MFGVRRASLISTRRLLHRSVPLLNKNKPSLGPDENGLYFGQFTKEEYDKAARYVKTQYEKLESEIKGSSDIRENLANMTAFPTIDKTPGGIKLDNLSQILKETIKTTGPISLLSYMRQCLTHPEHGYYTTRNPLDAEGGDFITSPEISSMFGEMIGIWLFSTWANQNKPKHIRLIEFGPGKGTLCFDALTSFNKFLKGNSIVKEIILIEASPVLRNEQCKLLCSTPMETDHRGFNYATSHWGDKVWWVDTEKDIDLIESDEDFANYIIAHEFFDALPIKSFVKKEQGWRELVVEHTPSVKKTVTEGVEEVEGAESTDSLAEFHLTLSPKETPSSLIPGLSPRFKDLPLGSRLEICADAEFYLMKMIQLLTSKKNGAVLIIDYGLASGVPENTLRGIYKHKFVSPFFAPGEVDLSVDVDFENLKLLLTKNGIDAFGPVEQGDWLHECGIGYRAETLLKSTSDYDQQEKIYNAYMRLTDKGEKGMGKIYKFLCLMPAKSQAPVGFGGAV